LALALIPSYLVGLAPNLLAATGHVKRRLQISLWFSPVHLAGLVVASMISLPAVAAVWAFSNSVMLGMYIVHLKKVLNASAGELFKPSLASVTVAAVSLATQALVLVLCREFGLPALLNLILVTAAGGVSWLAAVRWTGHPLDTEIRGVLAHVRARFR
jgi:hypothetical protein